MEPDAACLWLVCATQWAITLFSFSLWMWFSLMVIAQFSLEGERGLSNPPPRSHFWSYGTLLCWCPWNGNGVSTWFISCLTWPTNLMGFLGQGPGTPPPNGTILGTSWTCVFRCLDGVSWDTEGSIFQLSRKVEEIDPRVESFCHSSKQPHYCYARIHLPWDGREWPLPLWQVFCHWQAGEVGKQL